MVALGNFLYRTRLYVFPAACLLVFLPGPRIWQEDLVAAFLGFAIALTGQLIRAGTIGLVYIVRGGKNRRVHADDLVTDGVFGHSRNPMYVGNLLILSGMAVTSNCWTTVLVAIPLTAFIYRAIVAAEENYLRGRFGAAFDDYCRNVPRFAAQAPRPRRDLLAHGFPLASRPGQGVRHADGVDPRLVRHRRLEHAPGRRVRAAPLRRAVPGGGRDRGRGRLGDGALPQEVGARRR